MNPALACWLAATFGFAAGGFVHYAIGRVTAPPFEADCRCHGRPAGPAHRTVYPVLGTRNVRGPLPGDDPADRIPPQAVPVPTAPTPDQE